MFRPREFGVQEVTRSPQEAAGETSRPRHGTGTSQTYGLM
jgi:hypothetical protein